MQVSLRRTLTASFTAALLATAPPLLAQQPATIRGTVSDSRSGRPIAGAQISVPNTQRGTIADASGRFALAAAANETVTLRVAFLGYRPASVAARADDPPLDVKLDETSLQLDQVVVTGTAGGVERRTLGNTVTQINAADVTQIAPAPDLGRLINGRAPGVVLQSASGSVGNGNKIRIRGITSLSLTNEPLLYVDGVRVDNNVGSGPSSNTKPYISRMNDLNPGEIESIEIIKGPAAATLYGTEASNGVIQVITKKGSRGAPRVVMSTTQGVNWLMNAENRFPTSVWKAADGSIVSLNMVKRQKELGTPIFRTGHRQEYDGEVSGGTEALQYFVAGEYQTDEGALENNHLRRLNGRGNVKIAVNDKLDVTANYGYVTGRTYINGESGGVSPLVDAFVPRPDLLNGPTKGFNTAPPDAIYRAFTLFGDINRTTAGVQLNHRPTSWLTQRLVVGTDAVHEDNESLTPRLGADIAPYFGATALGAKRVDLREAVNLTADYGASASRAVGSRLGTRTSVGAQYYRKRIHTNFESGTQFPAPGVTTISSAAVITGGEDLVENATVGLYIEEQLSWRDRLYLTGAVRGDDNSAFGSNFNLAYYPKVSASWVLSEESFWPKRLVPTFRLRGAYGQSGQQPDAFAALLSYEPVTGPGNTAAVRPQFLGNPNLGPERGSEIEAGFEAAVLGDRVGLDMTYYDKRTKDAILARTVAPSLGFPGTQFVNIGEVRNSGFELGVTARPINQRSTNLDLRFTFSSNANKILDMGGIAPISLGVRNLHREGYPVAALFDRRVVSADIGTNGRPTNLKCDGGPENQGRVVDCATAPRVYLGPIVPKYEGAFASTLTLGGRLSLYGLVDFKYGQKVFDANIAIRCIVDRLCPENINPSINPVLAAGYDNAILGSTILDAGFAKLRQLSASYILPSRFARTVGASSGATITVSGRNLHTWSKYPGVDPELTDIIRGNEHYNQNQLQMPQLAQFLTSLRLTF